MFASRISSTKNPTLAKVLTAASLALGTTEVVAPSLISQLSGIKASPRVRTVVRALGVRELAHGFAVHRAPALVWTRVAGDVLDLALLAAAHQKHSANRKRGFVAAGFLTGVAALDVAATNRYSLNR